MDKVGDHRVQLSRQSDLRAERCASGLSGRIRLTKDLGRKNTAFYRLSYWRGATDASSNAWGGAVSTTTGPFLAGGDFPSELLASHINSKENFPSKWLASHISSKENVRIA